MKKLCILSLVLVIGCSRQPASNNTISSFPENQKPIAKIEATFSDSHSANVYLINIEGKDYVIVMGLNKIAICPKANN